MDSRELKNILHEQKIPLDEAVKHKLDYLKSDHVFTGDHSDEWTDLAPNTDSSDNMSFEEAFGISSADTNSSSVYRTPDQTPESSQTKPLNYTENISEPKRQMTLAERIAVLRGAVSVTQSVSGLKKY